MAEDPALHPDEREHAGESAVISANRQVETLVTENTLDDGTPSSQIAIGQFFPKIGEACSIVAEPRELTANSASGLIPTIPLARAKVIPGSFRSTSLSFRY